MDENRLMSDLSPINQHLNEQVEELQRRYAAEALALIGEEGEQNG